METFQRQLSRTSLEWRDRDLSQQDDPTRLLSSSLYLGLSSSNRQHKQAAYQMYSTGTCYPLHSYGQSGLYLTDVFNGVT